MISNWTGKRVPKAEIRRFYFAYGTNIPTSQMYKRCEFAQNVGWGWLDGYRLCFGTGGFATILPEDGAKTPVAIYGCSSEDFERLDQYEGYPHYYDRIRVEVVPNNKEQWGAIYPYGIVKEFKCCAGQTYIMTRRNAIAHPNKRAIEIAREGYKELGMPEEYLQEAIGWSVDRTGLYIGEVWKP